MCLQIYPGKCNIEVYTVSCDCQSLEGCVPKDPLRKGHCMLDLSTRDTALKSRNITYILILRRGRPLYKGQKTAKVIIIVLKVS